MRRVIAELLLTAALASAAGALPPDFYAFDNGTGRDQQLPFAEQAAILRQAGYAGMGLYTGTQRIPELLAALDAEKLRLLAIYVQSFVDDTEPRLDPGLPDAIRQLAGRETMIMLTLRGHGPEAEARAVDNVRRVADLAAAAGLRVCLYPHVGFHAETTADALRIAQQTGRRNVGVALNLYHAVQFHRMRCGEEELRFDGLLKQALPRLCLISINGIQGSKIVPLGQGDYDVATFLKALDAAGYSGPVALQSYQVTGSVLENLQKSRRAWLKMRERIGRLGQGTGAGKQAIDRGHE